MGGAQSPLQPSGTDSHQHTFLPPRGLYYAVIAGVIAGVFTALLTIVIILVSAGIFQAARLQIAMDRLTVKTALALATWELLNVALSLLASFFVGFIVGRIAVRTSRRSHRLPARCPATALPANADRDRRGEEFDHHLPAAY